MKIRKTRIKKTTKANGSVQYVAEYKWGFWWYEFGDMFGGDTAVCNIAYEWVKAKETVYHTKEEAKELINFYTARVKYQNACEDENRVVKVEYEGYP